MMRIGKTVTALNTDIQFESAFGDSVLVFVFPHSKPGTSEL